MSDRGHAHQLIDRLQEPQLSALVGLLETIVDPAAMAVGRAPVDDEPETDEEKPAVFEARDWLSRREAKGSGTTKRCAGSARVREEWTETVSILRLRNRRESYR